MRRARYSRKPTNGSPKALTPPISRRQKCCSTSSTSGEPQSRPYLATEWLLLSGLCICHDEKGTMSRKQPSNIESGGGTTGGCLLRASQAKACGHCQKWQTDNRGETCAVRNAAAIIGRDVNSARIAGHSSPPPAQNAAHRYSQATNSVENVAPRLTSPRHWLLRLSATRRCD